MYWESFLSQYIKTLWDRTVTKISLWNKTILNHMDIVKVHKIKKDI